MRTERPRTEHLPRGRTQHCFSFAHVKQEEQHAADVVPRTRRAPTTLATRGGRHIEWQTLQRCDQGLREVVREILLLSTLCPVPSVVRGVRRSLLVL